MQGKTENDDLIERSFPRLTQNGFALTSEQTPDYNCVAWAAGEKNRWWWPDALGVSYWPPGVTRSEDLFAFITAFEQLDYQPCKSGDREEGCEKIAVYVAPSSGVPIHLARQLENGRWTSKIGCIEDIEHDLEDLCGEQYGHIGAFMKRKREASSKRQ